MFYEKYIWRSICLQSLNSQLLYRQMGMNQIQCYKFSTIDCFMWWILSIIAIKVKTLKLNSEANVPISSLSVFVLNAEIFAGWRDRVREVNELVVWTLPSLLWALIGCCRSAGVILSCDWLIPRPGSDRDESLKSWTVIVLISTILCFVYQESWLRF